MSETSITFPASVFPDGTAAPHLLAREIAALVGTTDPNPIRLLRVETADGEVTLVLENCPDPELFRPSLRQLVTAHRAGLVQVRSARYAEVDAKTDELIARGFPFQGLLFSTSIEAQSRMLGMDALRNDPAMTYPIVFNSLDDEAALTISDAATVHALVLTGIGYYRAVIDSGSALKAQVRAATTVDEVLAVVDPRE